MMIGNCGEMLPELAEHIRAADERFGTEGDNAAPDTVACELEPGHPGKHTGLLQAYSEGPRGLGREAWLSWDTRPASIVYLDADDSYCSEAPADAPADDEDGDYNCTLPSGHVGRHAFDYQSTDDRFL
jgi:hypothetical protein